MTNICDVCGKEEECVCACGCFGPVTYSICNECLESGKEPYENIVSYIACAGRFPNEINPTYQAIVRHQLELHNVSEEKFIADVDNCINEMYAFFN